MKKFKIFDLRKNGIRCKVATLWLYQTTLEEKPLFRFTKKNFPDLPDFLKELLMTSFKFWTVKIHQMCRLHNLTIPYENVEMKW